jgi:hypothetical protein
VESSNIPENIIFVPRESCFLIALRNTTLAVVETYFPGTNSDNVTSSSVILGSWEGNGSSWIWIVLLFSFLENGSFYYYVS